MKCILNMRNICCNCIWLFGWPSLSFKIYMIANKRFQSYEKHDKTIKFSFKQQILGTTKCICCKEHFVSVIIKLSLQPLYFSSLPVFKQMLLFCNIILYSLTYSENVHIVLLSIEKKFLLSFAAGRHVEM